MIDQSEDHDLVMRLWKIVRAADEQLEGEGGGTKHWIRDMFLPRLNGEGLEIREVDSK